MDEIWVVMEKERGQGYRVWRIVKAEVNEGFAKNLADYRRKKYPNKECICRRFVAADGEEKG